MDANAIQRFVFYFSCVIYAQLTTNVYFIERPHYLMPSTPNWLAPNPSERASPVLGAFRSAFGAILFPWTGLHSRER